MNLEVLCVSLLLMFGSLLLTLFFLIISKKPQTAEIRALGFLFAANAVYCVGYALELLAVSAESKLLFNHIQYIGLAYIAPIWFLLCLQFYKQQRPISWKLYLALLFIPTVTLVLNMTHTVNGIFYASYQIAQNGGISALIFTKGIWYYVEAVNKMLLLGGAIGLCAKGLAAATGVRKKQAAYLLILSVIGFVMTASLMLTAKTTMIDIVCVLLGIPYVLISVSIFRYELFNFIPLAYSTLFDVLDQPILILSDSKTIIKANSEAKRVFASCLNGNRQPLLDDLFDGEELEEEEGDYLYYKMENNRPRYYSVKLNSLHKRNTQDGRGYLAVLADTTAHVEQVRSLKTLADRDPLTGLYNRRYFAAMSGEMLSEAKTLGEPASLLIFDIDHFKGINDEYGHQAGDLILRSVSNSINRQVRDIDILARFGGDEFVLMLRSANADDAETAANRICAAVRDTKYMFDGRRIPVTLSVGIAGGRTTEFSSLDEILSLADKALYEAKTTGRNKVCVNMQCKQAV